MTEGTEELAAADDPVEEVLLTRTEAALYLERFGIRLKPATLARIWSTGGGGPPCRHIRSKPFYPRHLLEVWAATQITGLRTAAPAASQGRRHA